MKKIHNPHDHFFRQSMSYPQVAKEFFQLYLPQSILKTIDLNTLQLLDGSFISPSARLLVTDLMFSVQTLDGDIGHPFLLLEHQRSPDKIMAFRITRYVVEAMDILRIRTGSDKLSLIYPLVFYHGKQPYPYSTDVIDLFHNPAQAQQVFLKPFQLIDVNQIADDELKRHVHIGLLQMCMKYISAPDLSLELGKLLPLLSEVASQGSEMESYVINVLKYMLSAGRINDRVEFQNTVIENIPSQTGEKFMTIAEMLIAEGLQKGIQKGIQIEKMLNKGLSIEAISKSVGLSLIELKELQASLSEEH